jgi:hypothetical protein
MDQESFQLPPDWQLSFRLPDDLYRWGWAMQQMKSGPRKHPGGWWQFIFWRLHGLAEGDAELDLEDSALRVKIRRATLEEALITAIDEMRRASATLTPSSNYEALADRRFGPWLWTSDYSG